MWHFSSNSSRRRAALVLVLAAAGALSACGGDGEAAAIKNLVSRDSYRVGGTVSALSGSGLVLEDNGGDDLPVTADGSFVFATALASGTTYKVTVKTQPTSDPPTACSVSNATGTVGTANVTNVVIDCSLAAVATPTGSPVGAGASQSVDASGGTIVSPDNRLSVVIPPNALSSATTVTIQPITNMTPGGQGLSYRLGPDGQTFAAPVQISFNYSKQDISGSLPALLAVAYQNAQGYWQAYKTATLDTTHQTLSVTSNHFSDWSLLTRAQVLPAADSVVVNRTVALSIVYCEPVTTSDLLTTLLAKCADDNGGDWAVDSVPGGASATGTVASTGNGTATYKAPGTPPAANPVAVSAQALVQPLLGTETLVSNITVLPDCTAAGSNCVWSGTATYNASSGLAVTTQVTWNESSVADGAELTLTAVSGTFTFSPQPGCSLAPTTVPLTAANAEDTALDENSNLVINLALDPPQYYGIGWVTADQTAETCGSGNPEPVPAQNWLFTGGSPLFRNAAPNGTTLKGSYTSSDGDSWSWDFERTQ